MRSLIDFSTLMRITRRGFLKTGIAASFAPLQFRGCFQGDENVSTFNRNVTIMTNTNPSVAEYVVQRLAALGIKHVFGVPGDFAFPIDIAIERCKGLTWVGCSNELNAAYSADGYARIYGAAILSTTYNVGSAAALAGVMGCKAERVPIFHVVGAPSTRLARTRRHMHHSYADGNLAQFRQYHEVSVCTSAYLTPQNAVAEMERVIFEAVSQRMPVYVQIPEDYAYMPVIGTPIQGVPFAQTPTFLSDPTELTAALNAILYRLQHARFPVILAAFTIERYGLQKELEALLEATQIHFATTGMSKGLLPESTPLYIGMYNGEFSPIVSGIVKDADLVLDLGGVAFCDGETGEFSDNLDTSKVITVWPDYVEIGSVAEMGGRGEPSYGPIHMKDIFEGLAKQAPRFKKHVFSRPGPLFALEALDDLITKASFFFHLPRFLVPGDVLVVDTGVGDLIATEIPLPDGVQFQHALLWGSIGWGTAAALGVALADPSKRVILVQGDGGHQCTANQIGVMGRYGVNPIILLLNNGIYGVEEVVMGNDKPKNIQEFDKIAPWQYSMIPKAMGCSDWLALSVTKITEFPKVMEQARKYSGAAYIEIHLNPNVLFPALPENIRERLYQTAPPAV